MHKARTVLAALMLLMCGCDRFSCTGNNPNVPQLVDSPAVPTYAVVVGMENSRVAGSCPGAKYDSDRMYQLLSQIANETVLLQDAAATRQSILDAMSAAVEKAGDGLFVFYYSGHGGSDPFPDTGIEESDGKDEYLCPNDTYLRDNDIWKVISKCRGRVFLIADCCHSRTIFRIANLTLESPATARDTWHESGNLSMQCWSGCHDYKVSYGSGRGGKFTNALLRHYKPGMTYDSLWKKIEDDKELRKFQAVQRTLMGADFGSTATFR